MVVRGKMEETAKEMRNYNIKIMALQEIIWKGEGRIDKQGLTFDYEKKMPEKETEQSLC